MVIGEFMLHLRNEKLTARLIGPTWEVRFCLSRPPDRNSLLGKITHNPMAGSSSDCELIHP